MDLSYVIAAADRAKKIMKIILGACTGDFFGRKCLVKGQNE